MNLHTVDRDSPISLYEQVKRIYEEQITSGQLRQGDMLPADREICERYGVSRITVVKALGDLAQMGLIQRIQGKGSVVLGARVSRSLEDVAGFTETVRRQGLRTRAELLSIDIPTIDLPAEARALARPGGRIACIRRIRYVNDQPAVITNSYVREALAEQMKEHDLEADSFHELFERITGHKVLSTERSITPIIATPEMVALLHVPPLSAHFCFHSMTYLEGNLFIELAESVFRGDMFEFTAGVHRVRSRLS